jgi:LAO/AO transport system kinase
MIAELADSVLKGDRSAAARAITTVVDERDGYEELWKRLYPHSGRAHKIGFSGPPGSGKSTLIGRMIALLRSKGEKVGVLAVDPSSTYTGGAFLGDRLRIQEHALDPGVFIRSLASRGMVGGLTAGIFGAMHVLEAYGCDRILLETVGTGQDEVDIAKAVDTVVYLSTPSLGDEIQGLKAGSMEIGDVFVINKCDLEGKDRALADMTRALGLGGEEKGWKPPVVGVSALKDTGLIEFYKKVTEHRAYLLESGEGEKRRKEQALQELSIYLTQRLQQDLRKSIADEDLSKLLDKATDPVSLGSKLLSGFKRK